MPAQLTGRHLPPPGPGRRARTDARLTEKELDLLGVSCCGAAEFADAVAMVEHHGDLLARLISHEFPLDEAPEAIRFAMSNPAEVMKVVIRSA